MAYPALQLFINGEWISAGTRNTQEVVNPATGEVLGLLPHATEADLDRALCAADAGFQHWSKVTAFHRAQILRATAAHLRERVDQLSTILTLEQGKTKAESRAEVLVAADVIDWSADEARRIYGRVIPTRMPGVRQTVVREPIGPVAAFSPWNAPALLSTRKIAEALAAGCSCIIKPAEETPAIAVEIVRAFADAGLPSGVLNLVFGVPSDISAYLIASPVIRKVSFTGSTEAGRQLGRLAANGPKRITLELGGHAPVVVMGDVDVRNVAEAVAVAKLRNAGQTCISPTRILVQDSIFAEFSAIVADAIRGVRVGDGLDPASQMGPLANSRRMGAMERIVANARDRGTEIRTGGQRIGSVGNFWEPTLLIDPPLDSLIMNQEPFGPIAALLPFSSIAAAIEEANRLPYGLAAYAFTASAQSAAQLSEAIESGLIGMNTFAVNSPETPFGGVKDSGYGTEGGSEGLNAYLNTKYIAQM